MTAYDPEAMKVARDIFGTRVIFADKSYDALSGADGLAIVTEWPEFREPDWTQDQEADADAGHLRRPQPLQPGPAARPRLHLPVDGPPVSVLVTGGAGYIGSHAVKALRAAGQDVVIYDNLSAGHQAAAQARRARRSRSATSSDVRAAARGDARRTASTPSCTSRRGSRSASRSRIRSATTRTTSAARWPCCGRWSRAGVPHLIFSSTAATFGNPVETPITESHPQRPINAYGETKLAIERALPHFERAYGIRSVTLRYFNAAGADPGRRARRGPSPRNPRDSARDRRRARARHLRHLRRPTTRRRTAPACATTST